MPPVTTASLKPAANAAGWCASATTVTLDATDGGFGVDKTYYRPSSSGGFGEYSASARPVVSAQGVSTIEYYATDKNGNTESARTLTVRVDSQKPSTAAYKASVKKGGKVKLGYKVADDPSGCGAAKVVLKIYKGKALKKALTVKGTVACNVKLAYSWRCKLAAGAYTLKAYATDLAGNRQSKVGSARLTVK